MTSFLLATMNYMFESTSQFYFTFGISIALVLLPLCGILLLIYFLLTLPMRRQERARLFLDLLELGLKEGRTPENAIVDPASSRDHSLGVRFHLLADYLQNGARLGDALRNVPRLLPPQITAMLQTGERIGDVARVLPACRRLPGDSISQVRGATNYLILLAFVVTPVSVLFPVFINVLIIPKFREIFYGMADGQQLPPFTQMIFSGGHLILGVQLCMLAFVWVVMFAYVGGPRFQGWVQKVLPGVRDRLQFRLPWRRRRLQRDFSAMLAVLLDARVPENEAVTLAADATENAVFRQRAARAADALKNGETLPDALRAIDDTGELHWRIANALKSGRGFLAALSGWHESLDAKAFQAEQSAAQIATTALVLCNGFIIGSVVVAVFLALVAMVNEATLW